MVFLPPTALCCCWFLRMGASSCARRAPPHCTTAAAPVPGSCAQAGEEGPGSEDGAPGAPVSVPGAQHPPAGSGDPLPGGLGVCCVLGAWCVTSPALRLQDDGVGAWGTPSTLAGGWLWHRRRVPSSFQPRSLRGEGEPVLSPSSLLPSLPSRSE